VGYFRKRKLLENRKKERRMRQVGNVEIPQAFMAVLKLND
jgi:translation elongation factor EF-4